MKYLFKVLMVATLMAANCLVASAQNADRQRLSREKLAETQAKHIANDMGLDYATTKRFVETYCRCQKEVWALGPRPRRNKAKASEPMTDEQTEQAIKERFDRSEKLLDIRQKYYKEYSKFLTQKQIQQVYEAEKRIMNRLKQHRKGKR